MKNRRSSTGIAWKIVPVICCLVFLFYITGDCLSLTDDRAKNLIAKSVEAMGGEKAARGWATRTGKGHLVSVWPGWGTLHADCRHYVKKPDKIKMDNDYSAYDHPFFFTYYYNGGDAWYMVNLNSRRSPRLTANMERAMERVDGIAYFLAECDTFFLVEEVPDDSLVTGSTVERAGCVHEGDTILFDFCRKSHLPVRRIENSGTRHTIYEDYRMTGGLKVPFHTTTYENGAKNEEYTWEEIKLNEEIDDAIFEEDRPPQEQATN